MLHAEAGLFFTNAESSWADDNYAGETLPDAESFARSINARPSRALDFVYISRELILRIPRVRTPVCR